MKLWTDGRTHVQLLPQTGTLRVYRGKDLAQESQHDALRGDDVPLVVDPEGGRVYAGRPLVELSLDDLSVVATHGLDTPALTRLPDGRLATLEPGPMGPVLMVGAPAAALAGDWSEALPVELPRIVTVPQGVVEGPPQPNRLGMGARLSANEQGLVLADGMAGIVALLRPGAERFSAAWAYPATDETELSAHAFSHGVIAIPRIGMRDAHVHLLLERGGFAPLMQWGVACQAQAVTDEHLFCVDERTVVVFSIHNLAEPVTHRDVAGRIQAAAAGGGRFVVGFEEGIHILRLIGEGGLGVDTVMVEERVDLVARFSAEVGKEVEDEVLQMGRGGLAVRFLPDGQVEYAVSSVDPAQAEAHKARALALGATDVRVKSAEL